MQPIRTLNRKCSLAERLKAIERTKIDYSDLAIPEEKEDEKCQNESNFLPDIPKTPVFQEDESTNDQSLLSTESSSKSMHTPVLPTELQKTKKSLKPSLNSVKTSIQIKRQSESETVNAEPKKQLIDHEEEEDNDYNDYNEDDNVFQDDTYGLT
ncbi:hypothetical protein BpHYR1_022052 [Brachionus plicatilis]|uniref:Uncharacterized protein n=1 Tax=Brachionus plicatilis TaxID=10195 RepID=A0A3M7PSJ9_BRAPC|nr:hypothetical protein BpHYR1_022052 [Brachionus plicatilis]